MTIVLLFTFIIHITKMKKKEEEKEEEEEEERWERKFIFLNY
jgi:hypothetical protein